MTLALVLSGGGARGDFEVGAIECIYERGFQPDIVVGTSVGAINATKLAEGEGGPEHGLQGLRKIWLSLLWNSDMWSPESWLSRIDPKFANALINGSTPSISGPITYPVPHAWGWPAELAYGAANFINGVSWIASDGVAVLKAMGEFVAARALFNLEPIRAKMRSGNLDEARIAAWAATGKKLRLVMVNLETGRIRYVTEAGAVVESDHVTPVQFVQSTTPEIEQLEASAAAARDELSSVQQDLSSAAPGAKAALVQRIRSIRGQLEILLRQLSDARKSAPHVPLKVAVREGAIASSSIAVVFPPTKLGDDYYVDGGHRDILPLRAALDLGATQIIGVLASPPELDAPTLEHPAPGQRSYADANAAGIGARALIGVHLDEILHNEIGAPAGWDGSYRLIAPTIGLHEMLTIDPGLIRINMDYGYLRAADTLDNIDRGSPVSRDVDQIALLRAQQWRKECQLFGRPIPTAPDDDPVTPQPPRLAEIREIAGQIKAIVKRRRSAGRPLPARAVRWGQTWEMHPWLVQTAAPVTAITPRTDEILVTGVTNEGIQNGRLMFSHWAPASGWRGWLSVDLAYASAQSFIGSVMEGDRCYLLWVGPDRWVYHLPRSGNGEWGTIWPVGNSANGPLNGVPGGAVHGVSCQPGMLHVFYTNGQGRIIYARRDTAGGGNWPEHGGLSGGSTATGGHVTAVSRRQGVVDVFCVGTNGRIYTASWSVGGAWSGWTPIGNAVARPGNYISAVSRSADKLDLFVADTQGRTMSAAWQPDLGWRGWWHIQNGTTAPDGFVTAVCRRPDQLDIFTRGTNDRAYTAAWSGDSGWGGWWPINDARTNGPVWPVSRSQDKLDIFFTSPSRAIQTAAWSPGGNWGGPWPMSERWEMRE